MGLMTDDARTLCAEALPCPFCGSPATIEPWHGGKPTKKLIACSEQGGTLAYRGSCPVSPITTGETKREALKHWNTRA